MLSQFLAHRVNQQFHRASLSAAALSHRHEELWQRWRRRFARTALSKDFALDSHRRMRDVRQNIMPIGYDQLAPYVERIVHGEKNVLFSGRPVWFGLTSGTTGKHGKRIPYNQETVRLFASARRFNLAAVLRSNLSFDPLRCNTLTLGSSYSVFRKNGVDFGYVSGLLQQQIPWFMRRGMYPRQDRVISEEWQGKVRSLYQEVGKVSIQAIGGVPAVLLEMLRGICVQANVSTVNQIWPELQIVYYGGSDIAHFADAFTATVGHPLTFVGSYTSTESPVGLPVGAWTGRSRYFFNPDVIVSFGREEGCANLGPQELECQELYRVHVTMPNGLLQYPLNDIVRIVSLDPLTFEVVGRQGSGLNLATEKVTEEGLTAAVRHLQNIHQLNRLWFMVMPQITPTGAGYHVVLYSAQQLDAADQVLDHYLQEHNQDYRESRRDGSLQALSVSYREPKILDTYIQKNAERGQLKVPIVFRTRELFDEFTARL